MKGFADRLVALIFVADATLTCVALLLADYARRTIDLGPPLPGQTAPHRPRRRRLDPRPDRLLLPLRVPLHVAHHGRLLPGVRPPIPPEFPPHHSRRRPLARRQRLCRAPLARRLRRRGRARNRCAHRLPSLERPRPRR